MSGVIRLSVLLPLMKQKVHNRLTTLQRDGRLMELLKGSGLVLFFKILGALSGYAFVILVSRSAGASGYGVYELAYTAIMIITVLSRLGLESAIVKYISGYQISGEFGKIRKVYAKSAWTIFVMSVGFGVVFYALAEPLATVFDGPELAMSFRWMAIFTPVFALLQLNAEALRGLRRMRDFSLLQNGSIMGLAVLVFWLMEQRGEAGGLEAVQAFCYSITALTVWSFWLLFRSHRDDLNGARSESIDFSSVIRTALPMLVSGSMYLVMSWTDTLMVGYFLGDEPVGIYRFAFKMATLITFSQFAINSIAAPMLSSFHATQDVGGMRKVIHQIAWINLLLSLPIFIVFTFFPTWVLETAVGDEFVQGVPSLQILAIGQLVNALCGPVLYTLNMTGYERDSQRIMLWTAGLNTVLNLMLIPQMGILGAAIATTLSMMLWNVVAGWKVYSYFNIISLPLPWRWRPK